MTRAWDETTESTAGRLAPLGLALALLTTAGCAPGSAASATDPVEGGAASAAPAAAERPGGAPPAETAPSPAAGAGALKFEKTRHDFGSVLDIDELTCSFPFTNAGDEPVVIREVKASCGCTTPSLAKDTYQPGESDTLRATWDPKGIGRQSKTLTVRSDALPGGAAILTISAEITPFVRAAPATLALGDLRLGREHSGRITLTCRDPQWQVQSVRTAHPSVEAAIVEERADGSKVVEVTLGPQIPWGFMTSKVIVDVLGRPQPDSAGAELVPHTAEVTVSATLVGEVRISQPMFSIGKIPPAPFETEIVLSRENGAPFEVVDAQVAPGAPAVGLSVRAEKGTEDGAFVQRLILSGDASDYLGYVRGSVIFTTDVPGEGARTLRFGGNVVRE